MSQSPKQTTPSPSRSTNIPLTTIFTQPADCASHFTRTIELYTKGDRTYTHGGDIDPINELDPTCYPPPMPTWKGSSFSPGICPHGFTTAASIWATETMLAVCCPTGSESLDSDYIPMFPAQWGICFSNGIHNPSKDVVTQYTVASVFPSGITTIGSSTMKASGAFSLAYTAIMVAWQTSDLRKFPVEARPTFNLKNSAESAVAGLGATSNQSRIGIGVGVGVGVGVFVLCVVVGLLLFLLRMRRLQRQKKPAFTDDYDITFGKPELHDTSLTQRAIEGKIPELGWEGKTEQLADDYAVAELCADGRVELPGDYAYEKKGPLVATCELPRTDAPIKDRAVRSDR